VTWSEMNTRQRVACVVLLVPALVAYGVLWTVCRVSNAVGLE
jgi:hypothetical protein